MNAMSSCGGMDFIVLPDDDERVKDLPPDNIKSDGFNFFVRASDWPKLKAALKTESAKSHGCRESVKQAREN